MTNNDNKDPQITAEKACVEVPKEDTPYTLYLKQVAAIRLDLINQQAAELTQLKAKWEGLLEWVDREIRDLYLEDDPCPEDYERGYSAALNKLKSKLSPATQIIEEKSDEI